MDWLLGDVKVLFINTYLCFQCTTGESAPQGYSMVTLHTCIVAFIGVLGVCIQLKFPNVSPYATSYGAVMMDLFIIETCFYFVSLVVMGIQAAGNNTDLEDLMNKISLLLGSLSLILELLVLISPFGWIVLFFWGICLSCFVRKYYGFLATLYQNAAAYVVTDYGELKQKLVDLKCRLMDIIRNDGRMTENESQNQNHTNEAPV